MNILGPHNVFSCTCENCVQWRIEWVKAGIEAFKEITMRMIDLIVLHCSDTSNGKNFTVEDIDDWHGERGFLRREMDCKAYNRSLNHIGYHYVIYIDGSIHSGRAESEIGAHAQGYNSRSIGVCMVGRDKFTQPQWESLNALLCRLLSEYPKAKVKGHYSLDVHGKTCPNFNVDNYLANDMKPLADQILEYEKDDWK